ncbi:MAG: choice-of-anchor D domain-containing protein, partial [Gemmatimonadetes bacterium]|nr:choice-of-anchor D domain-containing protein [Gemmatimonadota bacterium]
MKKNDRAQLWILGILFLLATCAVAGAGVNAWSRAGTGLVSAVNAIATDADRPTRLYAGAEDGLYISSDGGQRWELTGAQLVGRSVLNLAIDSRDSELIFAGVSDGLFFSGDGGASWTAAEGIEVGVFAIASGQGATPGVFAGTFGRGVYASFDGGRSWEEGGEELAGDIVFALATSALETEVVYAGTARGLFVSRDRGASWETLGTVLQGMSVRSIYVPSRVEEGGEIVVGTFGDGIWRSRDKGESWRPINEGLEDLSVRSLAVDEEFAQRIYAATSTGGFFRTTDKGESWRPINESTPSLAARRVAVLPGLEVGDPKRVLGVSAAGGVWEISFTREPQLTVGRDPLLFGSTAVGEQQSAELQIANAGEATLRIASLSIEGNASFSVSPSQLTLAAGATHKVVVEFVPQSRGEKQGTLILASDDPDEARIAIPLSGTGVQGELSANLARIHFGEVRLGSFADTTVVLTNAGNASLELTNAFFGESAFRVLVFQPQVLQPGERMLLPVRFAPDLARGLSTELVVVQARGETALEIGVDGVGTAPAISASALRVDFGTVNLATFENIELEISNGGNADLRIEEAELDGQPFSATINPPLVIPPGESEKIQLGFLPLVSGTHRGQLRLVNDTPGESGRLDIELEGIGGGLTLQPRTAVPIGEGAADLLVADLNQDGLSDLAVADSAGGQLQVLFNDGEGHFVETAIYPGPSSVYAQWDAPVALAAAPIYNSGLDLIVADQVGRSISILENDGKGRFDHRREEIFIGHRVTDVMAVDLDADGDADIAVADGDEASLTLLFNNGQGRFSARVTHPVGGGPVALGAANLDADGHPDLVVANRQAGTVSVLFSDRNGGFSERRDFAVGLEPTALALVDFDADGDNDLLVGNQGSQEVTILRHERLSGGGSHLEVSANLHMNGSVVDLAASDLTADVFSDLVTAGSGGGVAFWENDAGEQFTRRDTLSTQEVVRRIAIADMTNDGANDIVVLGLRSLQLFVNQDTRRLDPPRPPTEVQARDVDRDLGRRIEISWKAPELDEQIGRTTEYFVYRADEEDGSFAVIDTVDSGFRSYVDLTATLGDVFYYYVTAANAALESLPSDTVWARSRPAPFFELELVDESHVSVGDTLKVRAFITPADHRIAGISLYLTFATDQDSALSLILPEAEGNRMPFRISSTLGEATVLENQLHPNSTNRANLSLAGLRLEPGVEPVELGEIWFRTEKDMVTFISIDDEPDDNRRSAVVAAVSGEWILPFIPERPMQVAARDFQVLGQMQLKGRESPRLEVQASLLFIDAAGDTLKSPLNDEDRLKPGIQLTLDAEGRFRLDQIPPGSYQTFAKVPTHLQGRVVGDTIAVGDSVRTRLAFEWVQSDSSIHTALPAGDANDDNRINLADFGVLVHYFGETEANTGAWPQARATDFDGDGLVGMADLFLLADHFGEMGMTLAPAVESAEEEAAKPMAAPGRVVWDSGGLALNGVGKIRGFSLLIPGAEEVEADFSESLWTGRLPTLFQWREGNGVRVA